MARNLLLPMEPVLIDEPFDKPDFVFQVKWDGVRMLASQTESGVELWNRKGRVKTRLYPEICADIASQGLPVGTILDGEMVSFGEHGRPDFRKILRRDLASNPRLNIPVCLVLFDYLPERTDTLSTAAYPIPLSERLAMLREAIKPTPYIQVTDDFDSGTLLFERMKALEMEGIVAKRRDSFYYPGRKHDAWRKVKCWRYIRADVVALKTRDGRPVSLIVADIAGPADGETDRSQNITPGNEDHTPVSRVIGHVSSGLVASDWRQILEYSTKSGEKYGSKEIIPLSRGLHARIRFLEWTHAGQLRSPVIESLEFDP